MALLCLALFHPPTSAQDYSVPPDDQAETPYSIIGKWAITAGKDACNTSLGLEITENTVRSKFNVGEEVFVTPYKIIGGNANIHIMESTDHSGEVFVTTVELIPGGIRIQTIDCNLYPEKCERDGIDLNQAPGWLYFVSAEACS